MASVSPKTQPVDAGSPRSFPTPPSLSFTNSSSSSSSSKPHSTRRCLRTSPGSLPILPYTNHEWAKAVADVKTDYANRQFRPCVSRCNEILDNLRDTTGVQPCYLIYLHFYAASAQETLARGLHHASPTRIALLNEAQDHYSKASHLISTTDDVISRRSSKHSSISSSSSGSSYVFDDSPTSTGSTRSSWSLSLPSESSSRATSILSLDEDAYPAPKDKKRRRSARTSVYSHDSAPRSIERPDSPTLGLPPLSECSFQDLLDAMPVPPPSRCMSLGVGLSALPAPAAPELSDAHPSNVQSARRCSLLLTDLQGQIIRHLSFIETDLVAAQNPPPTATNLGLDEKRCRSMELQARIERLRASGWRRPRFNAQRYEELRESAIADMLA